MNREELKKVSEMNSCKDCSFCLSKCPKCGSVNIGVVYRRYFKIDESEMGLAFNYSGADIYCYDCNPEIENEDLSEFDSEWETLSDDETMLKSVSSPELAKQLDKHYDNNKKYDLPKSVEEYISQQKSIEYFVDSYTYKNDTLDKMHISHDGEPYCLDYDNYKVFDGDFTYELSSLVGSDSVNLKCEEDKENPGKHFVLDTTHALITCEKI